MKIQTGRLVSLGYGSYVRSDEVVAVEPITDNRGPGRRSRVWVRGVSEPLVASRAEPSIVDDLVTPADEAAQARQQRTVLRKVVSALEQVPPVLRRVIAEEAGVKLDQLMEEAERVLA
jgi:hypothetical protein